jgi:hypothetical protein
VEINGNQFKKSALSGALAAALIDGCERPIGHNHQPIVFEARFCRQGVRHQAFLMVERYK